jgi:hypothetical protein
MMRLRLPPLPVTLAMASLALACARQPAHADTSARTTTAAATTPTANQRDLLQIAFRAASRFPLEPHHKNRSRAQEQALRALFELGGQKEAIALASDLAGYQRACLHADYAHDLAARGDTESARGHVKIAETQAAELKREGRAQQWQLDLVALKTSRAHATLGDKDRAAEAAAGIDIASTHAVDGTWAQTAADRAERITLATVQTELDQIDTQWSSLSLGQQVIATEVLARLHQRFFTEPKIRAAIEDRLARRLQGMPLTLRLDALERLVRTNTTHDDRARAAEFLAAMRERVDEHRWRTADRLPQVARLVELTHLTGDGGVEVVLGTNGVAEYHAERDRIVDIDRADVLRPLALAAHAIGRAGDDQALLALVIEEGMENPNSRPRCDDLVATLVAMARRGIEPNAALAQRIREIVDGLGDPW